MATVSSDDRRNAAGAVHKGEPGLALALFGASSQSLQQLMQVVSLSDVMAISAAWAVESPMPRARVSPRSRVRKRRADHRFMI